MSLSRRRFLESSALAALVAATGHAAEPGKMPTRVLGATGVRIPVVGMGAGSRFLSYKEEDAALAAMNRAIDAGVTYIDTAYNYGSGLSETRVGKIMATRRKEVFTPGDPARVTMYVCGPTVYNFAHIGNARPVAVEQQDAALLNHKKIKQIF